MAWSARDSCVHQRCELLAHGDYPQAVQCALRLPWTPGLMVFFGSALLILFMAHIALSCLQRPRKVASDDSRLRKVHRAIATVSLMPHTQECRCSCRENDQLLTFVKNWHPSPELKKSTGRLIALRCHPFTSKCASPHPCTRNE
jgi:hypothetical protein